MNLLSIKVFLIVTLELLSSLFVTIEILNLISIHKEHIPSGINYYIEVYLTSVIPLLVFYVLRDKNYSDKNIIIRFAIAAALFGIGRPLWYYFIWS